MTKRTVSIRNETRPEKFGARKKQYFVPCPRNGQITVIGPESHENHEKAPMFLHNPEADTHVASEVARRSHTPRNERNMGRHILPAKTCWKIWLCLFRGFQLANTLANTEQTRAQLQMITLRYIRSQVSSAFTGSGEH